MRRKSLKSRRRRRVNISKFLKFFILFVLIVAAILFVVFFLLGERSPLQEPAGSPGLSLGHSPSPGIQGELGEETPEPTPSPTPVLSEGLTIQQTGENDPSQFGFETDLMVGKEIVDRFQRSQPMRFGLGKEYTQIPGLLTFGGNNYRDTFTYGIQSVSEKKLTRVWEVNMGALDGWSGTGWTGMPVLVQWPAETRQVLGIHDTFKNMADFTEVIYPAMDGYIYFLELHSGEQTRDPIYLGVTTKGTASVDPRGYPLLYTGQGLNSQKDAEGNSGAWFRIIDLIQNQVIWKFGGTDPFSHRSWQAYDSSALVHAETDTLIAPGENGVLYTVQLNSSFDPIAGSVSVSPGNLEKYRYTGKGYGERNTDRWWGIENSITTWRNYGFFSDNGGRLQCVDLNTLTLMYVVDVTDDSDTSLVLEEDIPNDTFYLYTANEVDKQPGVKNQMGKSYHRKIDGLTGKVIWEKEWAANIGNTSSNGGTLSTPHVGRGSISDLVIYNATLVPVSYRVDGQEKSTNGGRIICYHKLTGEEVWRQEQASGYWSSPVVIYDENETAYLIQCDRGGMMRMYDPRTGDLLFELDMGSRMESTPAVFNNMLVVGTRGTHGSDSTPKIIGVKIS